MHARSAIILAFVAFVHADTISLFNGVKDVNVTVDSSIVARATDVSWDCSGSSSCKYLNVGDCDAAYRTINPGNTYATNGAAGNTGVCNGHCGIFVQHSNCAFSGGQLQNAYHNLRSHSCAKCGSEHEDNGCLITINYVTGC